MSKTDKSLIISYNGDHTSKTVVEEIVPRLNMLNWKINVTTLSDTEKNILEPRALFQFMLEDDNMSKITVMDLKLNELTKFYELLEKVQNDLDKISGEPPV